MRFWRPPLYQFELLAYPFSRQNAESSRQNELNSAFRLLHSAYCLLPTNYLVSLCGVWARQCRQNFLSSSRSVVTFLFLVDV
jgi:hypothetical protein